MDVRMPDGTIVTNVPEGVTQDEIMRRLNISKAPSAEEIRREKRTRFNPTEGMSTFDKVRANIGAGMSDLIMGGKQLYTDLTGTEDEKKAMRAEVAEKRERDKLLAESTDMGVAPDWMPTMGSALQVAGGVAPTMAIPVGTGMQALRMLPNAARAIAGRGALAAAPAKLGTAALAADATLMGSGYGAITPVAEGESRGNNILMQSLMGGAAPLAIAGGNQVRRMTTRAGGGERAGEQVVAGLTPEGGNRQAVLQQTLDRLRQTNQTAPGTNIPLSTAAAMRDAELARLEAGSRARNGANWYDFDQAQARSVWDDIQAATRGAEDVGARRALRSDNRQTLYNQAMSSVNEPAFLRDVAAFRSNLNAAANSAEASNPAVRSMLNAVADEIDRLGPNFRPEHLATIRASLSSKSPLMPTNAYQAAPRESPATMSVLREVDNILNNATGGRWQPVVSTYARDSDLVRASQAAGKVRDSFLDSATGRVRGVSADAAGDVPKVTEAGLGRALDAARGPRKDLVLDPTANARLEAILDALRAQNIVQGVKRSATAGGGSNTASDLMAAKAADKAADVVASAAGGIPGAVAKGALDKIIGAANTQRDRALAQALQNPAELIALLERQAQAGQPLTPVQQQLLSVLRGTPAAAAATLD